jgi:DNA-binding LacI/PurR family transcriptional regulator
MSQTHIETNSLRVLGDDTAVGRLVSDMRQAIESGQLRVGDKLATLRKLAQQYDISVDAARGAMVRLDELGYVTRRQGSGTYVTQRQMTHDQAPVDHTFIKQQQKKTISMLLDNKVHHYGRFYDHLVDCLHLGGYNSSVFTWRHGWGDEEMLPVLQSLDETPPFAMVIQQIDGGRYDKQIDAIAKKHGIRVISSFLGDHPRPEHWHSVLADGQAAAALAGRYLIERGHQRIGLVVHDRFVDEREPASTRKRWIGHSSQILGLGHAMRDSGIRNGMKVYYNQRIDKIHGSSPSDPINRELIRQWLSSPDCPTAFVGEDHRMAVLLRVAQEYNIQLPDNFQVVGIGNTPWASLMNFSSVWLREDLAAHHVINLIQMDASLFDSVAHRIKLQPQLVERS